MKTTAQSERLLDDWAVEVHATAISKGFWDGKDPRSFTVQAEKLALIHSEVTEVLEALRKEKGDEAVIDEFADILIRTFDLYLALYNAGVVTGSLDIATRRKADKNKTRPHMHGVRG